MEIVVYRKFKRAGYTIGEMHIDGEKFCDTLEPEDRGLYSGMNDAEIKKRKIAGKTAIPTGCYRIRMDVVSPKYSKRIAYEFCEGKLPRLEKVTGFSGVLIHIGNWKENTKGCILVGRNVVKGGLLYSTHTFHMLYKRLAECKDDIQIRIK